MSAYYNEHDAKTAAWLRELIKAGLIADGEVDTRSITEVTADDVRGFVQCHFFAGIGGWSYALRLARWDDAEPVWTGSCPCQPFSAAGKGDGEDDSRDLWPAWFRLIRECRPSVVFGEQVEAGARGGWLDRLSADLEGEDYAVGAVVLGAHSVGAPHIRQRLWFVADAGGDECRARRGRTPMEGRAELERATEQSSGLRYGVMAYPDGRYTSAEGLQRSREHGQQPEDGGVGRMAESSSERRERERLQLLAGESRQTGAEVGGSGEAGELGDPDQPGLSQRERYGRVQREAMGAHAREAVKRGSNPSFWSSCDWLPCLDGKSRPVEPGTFPLAHGVSARVGRLRGFGNAIVPQVGQVFIQAYLEAEADQVRLRHAGKDEG